MSLSLADIKKQSANAVTPDTSTTPETPVPGAPLTLAQIKAAAPAAPEAPAPQKKSSITPVGAFARETATEAGKQFDQTKQNLTQHGQEFIDAAGKGDLGGEVKAGLRSAAEATGGAARIAFSPLTTLLGHVVDNISNMPTVQHLATKDSVGKVLQHASDLSLPLGKVAENHPQTARDVQNIIDTISLVAGPKGVKAAAPAIEKTAAAIAPKAAEAVSGGTEQTLYQMAKARIAKVGEGMRPREIDALEKKYAELAGTTQKTQKILTKGEKATEAKNAAGTQGQAPARLLAENGIIPKQKGSRLDTLEQADSFRNSTDALRDTNRKAIAEVEPSVQKSSLPNLEEEAVKMARSSKNIDSGIADTLEAHVREAFAAYKREYGDAIPLTKVDDIKVARWKPVKFDSTKPYASDSNYLIAKVMQKEIESKASSAGYEDVAQLNRHIGDRLEAAKFLESLNNKVVKGGRLSKYVYQGIGASMGHSIPGKIVGALGGDAMANLMISNSVAGPLKRLILRNLEAKDPEAYTRALEWLHQRGVIRENTPRLPAPAPLGSTKNPIVTPHTSFEAPAQKIDNQSLREGLPQLQPALGTKERPIITPAPAARVSRYGGSEAPSVQEPVKFAPTGKQGGITRYSEQADSTPGTQKAPVTRETPKNAKPGGETAAFAAVAGVQPDKDGNIKFDPLKSGLAFLGVRGLQKIHVEDLGVMRDFSDYVNGAYKPAEKELIQLKKDAQNIADHYKIPNSAAGDKSLSNSFGKILDKLRFDKKIDKPVKVRAHDRNGTRGVPEHTRNRPGEGK